MRLFLLVAVLVLSSCSSTKDNEIVLNDDEEPNIIVGTISDTFEGVIDTIQSPFRDLGLVGEDIPPKLIEVSKDPYVKPSSAKCKDINEELAELDSLLGTDAYTLAALNIKSKEEEEEGSYLLSGAKMASGFAAGKVAGKISLPLRGVVRKISGADAHEKKSAKAYQAAELRRAYLRGLMDGKGAKCAEKPDKKKVVKSRPSKKYSVKI